MDQRSPRPGGRGSSIMMLLVLLAVIAAVATWAWLETPPGAPDPSATAPLPSVPAEQTPQRD